jgi:hypothetical protein
MGMEGSLVTLASRAKVPEYPLPEWKLEGAKMAFSEAIETIPSRIRAVNRGIGKNSTLST